jgi:hypothetical protein
VNKDKRRRAGLITPRPFLLPRYARCVRSFLALLLLASQEVVRYPPYGVCGSAHPIGDPANRSGRGCLKESPTS